MSQTDGSVGATVPSMYAAKVDVFPVGELDDSMAAVVEPRSTLKAEIGVEVVADDGEIQVSFSQVHRVVSAAIGSRFWRLQEGDSSDDEEIILVEVADES